MLEPRFEKHRSLVKAIAPHGSPSVPDDSRVRWTNAVAEHHATPANALPRVTPYQVAAVVGVLVFTQFLEPIARTAGAFVEGLDTVTNYLPGAASDALVGASIFQMAGAGASTSGLEWWAGGAVLLGYALVLLVLGYALNWRRDVS